MFSFLSFQFFNFLIKSLLLLFHFYYASVFLLCGIILCNVHIPTLKFNFFSIYNTYYLLRLLIAVATYHLRVSFFLSLIISDQESNTYSTRAKTYLIPAEDTRNILVRTDICILLRYNINIINKLYN